MRPRRGIELRLVKFSVMKYSASLTFPWLFFSYGGMLSAYMGYKYPNVIDVGWQPVLQFTWPISVEVKFTAVTKVMVIFLFFLMFQPLQLFLLFRLLISCSLHNIRETINSLNIKLPCHEQPRRNISLQHQADKWWDWRKNVKWDH